MGNRSDADEEERWNFEETKWHRWSSSPERKGNMYSLVKWKGYKDMTWEPMYVIKVDDPMILKEYSYTME